MGKVRRGQGVVQCTVRCGMWPALVRRRVGTQGVWQAGGLSELHACDEPLRVSRRLTQATVRAMGCGWLSRRVRCARSQRLRRSRARSPIWVGPSAARTIAGMVQQPNGRGGEFFVRGLRDAGGNYTHYGPPSRLSPSQTQSLMTTKLLAGSTVLILINKKKQWL